MKLPRKGILIRLAIYVPLLAGLGIWRACYFEREEIVVEPAPTQRGRVRTMVGPDGEQVEYLEITPDEAKAMGVKMPEPPAEAPTEDESKAQ